MKLENKDLEILKNLITEAQDDFRSEILYHLKNINNKDLYTTDDVMKK